MTDQSTGGPRRRSAVEPSAMTSALFSSFTKEPPAPAPVADEPAAAPAPAAVAAAPDAPEVSAAEAAADGAGEGGAPARARSSRPTPERGTRAKAPAGRPAPGARRAGGAAEEGAARPGRPVRPRLVEPTEYATKHREVKVARVQTLLREGDVDVLDELARLTLAETGEATNRSELLRAMVEAVDTAGVAEELAACGTHRQRVAWLVGRLRGAE